MKRTHQIAIRITPDTYKALETIAKEKDWSIAHTANRIIEKSQEIKDIQGKANLPPEGGK